jgi:hypothetical protein
VTEQAAAGFALPGGHLLIVVNNPGMDEIVKLPEGFDSGHFLPFKLKTVTLLDDHYDIDKIQAVNANLLPGSIRFDEMILYFKLFN